MARWRLRTAHYLNVPGTEWEHKETNRDTGKQARKLFLVPLMLDPQNGADCDRNGEIIVTNSPNESGTHFIGDPTPDMEPLDDEAEAISASFEKKWQHPIESLPGTFSQSLLAGLEAQLAEAIRNTPIQPINQSLPGVSAADFEALKVQVAALAARNAELETAAAQPAQRRA